MTEVIAGIGWPGAMAVVGVAFAFAWVLVELLRN